MSKKEFFWLHIKKSAGISTRRLLAPHYVEVDRTNMPRNFIQSKNEEYNDILNNYRVVLGEFQFKRALFAKTFLYPERWEKIISFAFVREPVDRCISMFYYLYWKENNYKAKWSDSILGIGYSKKKLKRLYAFDKFLDNIELARQSSVFKPLGLHFSTHTAPMWDDITDNSGNILLSKIFRLENLVEGINNIYETCNINDRIDDKTLYLNKNSNKADMILSKSQINKIELLFPNDFELYETVK